ncbi:hypothetical protein Ndes2526A_g03537 [Nannochloris sp. 'desiccata']
MSAKTAPCQSSQTSPAQLDQLGSPSNSGGATKQTSSLLLNHLNTYPVVVRELVAGGTAGALAKSSVAPLERCKILFQTEKNHHGVSPIVDLLAGSGAGATAVLVTYPLDLVRTRLAYITEAGTLSGNTSNFSIVKGAASAVGSQGTSTRMKTTTLPSAPSSGITSKSMHTGLRPDPHHSIRGVLSSTLRLEGIRGLYHGVGPSMYGILPYAGLKFYVYQHLKQAYLAVSGIDVVSGSDNRKAIENSASGDGSATAATPPKIRLPVPAMLAFGGIAGLIAQTVTYPLDVVRRRMQVEGLKLREPPVALGAPHFPNERLPQSTPAALVAIVRRQGWRVLYSGLSINYMKVVPSTAIGFTLYDYLKSALNLPTHL